MKFGKPLTIVAQLINIIIFVYFCIVLFKSNALDMLGLSISGFGILISLIANIVDVMESN